MKAALYLLIIALVAAAALDQAPAQTGDASLYKEHNWFALRERIRARAVNDPLVIGATAAAFGEDEKARHFLQPLLKGKHAADANEWLAYVEMRKGRYRAAGAYMDASSDKPDPLATTFRELPDQITVTNPPSTTRFRLLQRKLFLPVLVNGQSAELIFDSDANFSFLSETAAKQMGLAVKRSSATTTGVSGAALRLSMATADVSIGNSHLRNVAFAVLPDSASLFATLTPKQQGAVGIPVLLALERVS